MDFQKVIRDIEAGKTNADKAKVIGAHLAELGKVKAQDVMRAKLDQWKKHLMTLKTIYEKPKQSPIDQEQSRFALDFAKNLVKDLKA